MSFSVFHFTIMCILLALSDCTFMCLLQKDNNIFIRDNAALICAVDLLADCIDDCSFLKVVYEGQ